MLAWHVPLGLNLGHRLPGKGLGRDMYLVAFLIVARKKLAMQ